MTKGKSDRNPRVAEADGYKRADARDHHLAARAHAAADATATPTVAAGGASRPAYTSKPAATPGLHASAYWLLMPVGP